MGYEIDKQTSFLCCTTHQPFVGARSRSHGLRWTSQTWLWWLHDSSNAHNLGSCWAA